MLQAFISLWSGAPVGPEGPLTFLTGGFGTYLSERLKLKKDDVQVLVYSSIAGAFGGFFGSPVIGAVGAIEYMFIKELDLRSSFDSRPIGWRCWIWRLLRNTAGVISRNLQLP